MTKQGPIDFATLRLSNLPNQALLLPPGFVSQSKTHLASPVFPVDADRAMPALIDLIESEPRVSLEARFDARRQVHCVARSAILGFPDDIWCQIEPHETGGAVLLLYSRARFGLYDFGVNRRRMESWVRRLKDLTAG